MNAPIDKTLKITLHIIGMTMNELQNWPIDTVNSLACQATLAVVLLLRLTCLFQPAAHR